MKPLSLGYKPLSLLNSLKLVRLPHEDHSPLRAWDAADEFVLDAVDCPKNQVILIINDAFGALSCGLADYPIQHWSDSVIARLACENNIKRNGLTSNINYLKSTEAPVTSIDTVLIKIPKTLALLEYQLQLIKPMLSVDTQVIGAGMVKHLPSSAIELFEKIIGSTHTSLAKKKARLIFSKVEQRPEKSLIPAYPHSRYETDLKLELSHHANVFSKDKLDIGARFMLEQFKYLPKANTIVDLGCGNGVLGIMAQRQQEQAELHFVDESYMAIDSAKTNYEKAHPTLTAQFWESHCLEHVDIPSADLIICNPPFHQNHAVGDQIAWQMMKQSRDLLEKGGELWLVGNRHLNYHSKLKKLFGNSRSISSNRKFDVLCATKN